MPGKIKSPIEMTASKINYLSPQVLCGKVNKRGESITDSNTSASASGQEQQKLLFDGAPALIAVLNTMLCLEKVNKSKFDEQNITEEMNKINRVNHSGLFLVMNKQQKEKARSQAIENLAKQELDFNSSDAKEFLEGLAKETTIKGMATYIQSKLTVFNLHTGESLLTNTSGSIKALLLILSKIGELELDGITDPNAIGRLDIMENAKYFFDKINCDKDKRFTTKAEMKAIQEKFEQEYEGHEAKGKQIDSLNIFKSIDPENVRRGIDNFFKLIQLYQEKTPMNQQSMFREEQSQNTFEEQLNISDSIIQENEENVIKQPSLMSESQNIVGNSQSNTPVPFPSADDIVENETEVEVVSKSNEDDFNGLFEDQFLANKTEEEIQKEFNDEEASEFEIVKLKKNKSFAGLETEELYSKDDILKTTKDDNIIQRHNTLETYILSDTNVEEGVDGVINFKSKEPLKAIVKTVAEQKITKSQKVKELQDPESIWENGNGDQEAKDVAVESKQKDKKLESENDMLTDPNYIPMVEFKGTSTNGTDPQSTIQQQNILLRSEYDEQSRSRTPSQNDGQSRSRVGSTTASQHNDNLESRSISRNNHNNEDSQNSTSKVENAQNIQKPIAKTGVVFNNGAKTKVKNRDGAFSNEVMDSFNNFAKTIEIKDRRNESINFFVNLEEGIKAPLNKFNIELNKFFKDFNNKFIQKTEICEVKKDDENEAVKFLAAHKKEAENYLNEVENEYDLLNNIPEEHKHKYTEYYATLKTLEDTQNDENKLQNDLKIQNAQVLQLTNEYNLLLQTQRELLIKCKAQTLTVQEINVIEDNNKRLAELKTISDNQIKERQDILKQLQERQRQYKELEGKAKIAADKIASVLFEDLKAKTIEENNIENVFTEKVSKQIQNNFNLNVSNDTFIEILRGANEGLFDAINVKKNKFKEIYTEISDANCSSFDKYDGTCTNLINSATIFAGYSEQDLIKLSFANVYNIFETKIVYLKEQFKNIDKGAETELSKALAEFERVLLLNDGVVSFKYNECEGNSDEADFAQFQDLTIYLAKKTFELENQISSQLESENEQKNFLINKMQDDSKIINKLSDEFLHDKLAEIEKNSNVLIDKINDMLSTTSYSEGNIQELARLKEELKKVENEKNGLIDDLNVLDEKTKQCTENYNQNYENYLVELKTLTDKLENSDTLSITELESLQEQIGKLKIQALKDNQQYTDDLNANNGQLDVHEKTYNEILDGVNNINTLNNQEIINSLQPLVLQPEILIGGQAFNVADTISNEPSILKKIRLLKQAGLQRAQSIAQNQAINNMKECMQSGKFADFIEYNEIGVGCNHFLADADGISVCENGELKENDNVILINGKYYIVLKNIDVMQPNVIQENSYTLIELGDKIQNKNQLTMDLIQGVISKKLLDLRTFGIGKETKTYLFDNAEAIQDFNKLGEDLSDSYNREQIKGYVIGETVKEIYDIVLEEELTKYNNDLKETYKDGSYIEQLKQDALFSSEEIELFKVVDKKDGKIGDEKTKYVIPIKQSLNQNDCLVPVKIENAFGEQRFKFYDIKFTERKDNETATEFKLEVENDIAEALKSNVVGFSICNHDLSITIESAIQEGGEQINKKIEEEILMEQQLQSALDGLEQQNDLDLANLEENNEIPFVPAPPQIDNAIESIDQSIKYDRRIRMYAE